MDYSKYRIRNVWTVRGDGSDPQKAEVLISSDGKILSVGGPFIGCGEIIDGNKRILSPGFIDAHGHSDLSVLAYPDGFSKVSQGVTTEIAGNCGLSAFPLTGENREHLEELYANYNYTLEWSDFTSYRQVQEKRACFPDVIPLCGHNTLRAAVAGYEKKTLSGSQLSGMKELLSQALEAGSPGMSTGLLYVPGKFASDGEIIELMKILASAGKIYTTHLRSEGDQLLESLENTLYCASVAGLKKVQISHFKTALPQNWHKLSEAIDMIQQARRNGMEVTVDRYPYTESMTQLSVVLPGKWSDMDDSSIQKKLQNKEERWELVKLLEQEKTADYWNRVRLASTGVDKYRQHCGKLLSDISDFPTELVVELLATDAPGTCGAFSGMSPENLDRIMLLDFCMPGSDGNALPGDYSAGRAHPRAFGTLPRFIRKLLELDIPIGESVRRATGLPARTFGLADRGALVEGKRADLILWDPDELTDTADFSSPHSPARGIILTMCGGKIVYRA
ncbi:MAG: amidohydrolase family protein [Lentisphaeria bacterium]|nr:amidohydrolase family protein [Lentisphaeria bacterium]